MGNSYRSGLETEKTNFPTKTAAPQNDGWKWMVVFGSFLVTVIMGGLSFTMGLLYIEIMELMDTGKAEVAWIGSFLVGFTWISAIFSGPLSHIIGYRLIVVIGGFVLSLSLVVSAFVSSLPVLYITLGILPGIGLNMAFMGSIIAINTYFVQRQSLALSFALCGTGLGTTVFAPTVQWLLETYDFQGTILIMSALCLHIVPCGCLYFPLNNRSKGLDTRNKEKNDHKTLQLIRDSLDVSVLSNVYFVLFLVSNCLTHIGLYVPTAFLPEHVVSIGFSPSDSSLLLSVFGISGIVGRLLTGPLSERFSRKRLFFCIIFIFLSAVSTLLMSFSKEYRILVFLISSFGLFIGGMIILYAVLLIDLFGINKLPTTMSFATLAQGVGSVIGAPVAGMISDIAGLDEATFLFASFALVLGALVLIPILKDDSSPNKHMKEFKLDVMSTSSGDMGIRVFVIDFDMVALEGAAAA